MSFKLLSSCKFCRVLTPIQALNNTNKLFTRSITSPKTTQTSPLFILRQKTGIAYSLCREALNKHNNDVKEAEAWLKAQALAHGLQKATKVRGRNTSEGLIGLAIHSNNKIATVIELNCETDFVAKNQIFKDLAIDLTHQISTMQNNCDTKQLSLPTSIVQLSLTETQLKKLDNQIVPIITKLGENIRIHNATHYKVTSNSANLFGQIHSQTGHKINDKLEVMSGRFGAIVALEDLDGESKNRSLKPYGNRLCQHVIGFSPTYIELPDNIRKHLEELEEDRKRQNEAQNSDKFLKENNEPDDEAHSDQECEEQNNRDDWPSIMDQQIIMSNSETVRDFCKNNKLSILYFNRFECGSD